jgi:hypothetical protein
MFGLPRKYFKILSLWPKYIKFVQNSFEQNIYKYIVNKKYFHNLETYLISVNKGKANCSPLRYYRLGMNAYGAFIVK